MTTKLEILGPYTPEHEGPYVWVKGNPVRCVVHAVVGDSAFITAEGQVRPFLTGVSYIRNAKEIPVAREFWLNEFKRGDGYIGVSHAHDTELHAINERHELENWNWTRTIHVREVMPGDDQ